MDLNRAFVDIEISAIMVNHWLTDEKSTRMGGSVRVDGQLVYSNIGSVIDAALDGMGLAYAPTGLVRRHIDDGYLLEVIKAWCPTFQGYHLYYPNRRNHSPAFSAFVDAFRFRPGSNRR